MGHAALTHVYSLCELCSNAVEKTKDGASISLKLQDGRGSIVRVYVGALPLLSLALLQGCQ